jgi:hypothetical protein
VDSQLALNALEPLNDLDLSSFWEILLGGLLAVVVVCLVELARTPAVKIEKSQDLVLPDGRKVLKVRVTATSGLVPTKVFPWKRTTALARLKLGLDAEDTTRSFTLKWDTAPEPWDYEKNIPRLDLLPAAYSPENFIVGDSVMAALAIKHPRETGFYIFDPNYYVRQSQVAVDGKQLRVRLAFRSSTVSKTEYFTILNGSTEIDSFELRGSQRRGVFRRRAVPAS